VSAGQLIDSVREFFPRAYLTLANWTIIDYDEPDYILSSIDDDVTHNTEKRKIKRIAGFPFFLILSGFYAILYLLGENLGQISIEATGRSFLVALVASLIISGGCIWLIRPRDKAYLAGGLLNLAFFSYGHLFNLIDARTIDGFLIGRHSFFFSVFLVIVFGAFLFTLRSKNSHLASVIFLNVLLITLSIFQITRIAVYQASTRLNARNSDSTSHQDPYPSAQTATRDIYYIILDGVVREDVMEGELGYTDYSLPEELKKRGFVIPECAFSNYGTTSLSMTSSLNMNYLNKLGIPDEWVNTNKDDPPELNNLLHQNQVMRYLKQRGYSFVSFRGFFPINDFKEADYYFNFFENQQGQDVLAERSFYDMFVRTTLLRLPSELIEGNPQIGKLVPRAVAEFLAPEAGMFSSRSYQWYKQHIYNFDMLETVPSMRVRLGRNRGSEKRNTNGIWAKEKAKNGSWSTRGSDFSKTSGTTTEPDRVKAEHAGWGANGPTIKRKPHPGGQGVSDEPCFPCSTSVIPADPTSAPPAPISVCPGTPAGKPLTVLCARVTRGDALSAPVGRSGLGPLPRPPRPALLT